MMPVHKLHRARRDGTARTFCGRLVQRYENSRREILLVYSHSFRGIRAAKAQLLAVTLENTTVKATCKQCLQVK